MSSKNQRSLRSSLYAVGAAQQLENKRVNTVITRPQKDHQHMRILPALAVITIIPLSSTVAVGDNFIGNGPPPSPTSPPPPSPTSPPVPSPTSLIRSFVSGKGNDANPCTATSPCQTFQAALAVTAAGGTIYALDSANY